MSPLQPIDFLSYVSDRSGIVQAIATIDLPKALTMARGVYEKTMSADTKELQRLAAWHDARAQKADLAGEWTELAFHLDAKDTLRRVATILAAPSPPSSLPPAPPEEE